MNAIRDWFTPATREKIYTAIAALAPILVAAGLLLPGQVEPILVLIGAGLQIFSGVLALVNLRVTEAARWFNTAGRAVIYGGATTVAGAVVALGFITEDWANSALTFVSLGLTALQAIIAVVTPKDATYGPGSAPVIVKAVITTDNAVIVPKVENEVLGQNPARTVVIVDPSATDAHGQ